jgi:hypothetical protein
VSVVLILIAMRVGPNIKMELAEAPGSRCIGSKKLSRTVAG